MLCAHTVRRLKPGTFDQFSEAFRLRGTNPPAGMGALPPAARARRRERGRDLRVLRRDARGARRQPAGVRLPRPARRDRPAGGHHARQRRLRDRRDVDRRGRRDHIGDCLGRRIAGSWCAAQAGRVTRGLEDDHALLKRLRAGDESAFEALLARHDGALRRVARTYVRTDSAADEVVQETWLGVLRGLTAFEGRSSLRTWIFRILVNQARTRAVRDARSLPFSALEEDEAPRWSPPRSPPTGAGRAPLRDWTTSPSRVCSAPSCASICSRPSTACRASNAR